ncbi:MAG: hypothetical protein L3J35_08690 [Bacteroidales bacterium]|nr:hypothetical protein [Bacteroidales bacterium]
MKKLIFTFLFCFILLPMFGQEGNVLQKHQLDFDFGSYRNRYLYAVTDLKYISPLSRKANLNYSVRIRSYGTLFFYSKSAYDFTPFINYYFTNPIKPIYFSIGLGVDTRIRLVNDIRSEATTGAEPIISTTIHGDIKNASFNLSLWTRFYSNGSSFNLLPEFSYKIGSKISLFIRYELNYLKVYGISAHKWKQDSFFGMKILF